MKKSLIKNNLKTISKTRRRFVSILIMAFLGVGFYSGLVASSPDMLDSLDKYVDESKMFDINIISTLGLTEDDVNAIREIEGIEEVYGIQTKDTIVQIDDEEDICKVIEYNENINKPTVIAGRLPENSNECLIDNGHMWDSNVEELIGKTIVINNEDTNSDGSSIFTVKEFTIVGIAESPIYISSERGSTSIGNGSVDFYIYTQDDVINLDYYTEIDITVEGASELVTNSDEYLELVNPIIQKVEEIKSAREEARYNELINEATEQLEESEEEFNKQQAEVEQELSDVQKQIDDAKQELAEAEEEILEAEAQIIEEEKSAEKQFAEAEAQIAEAEATIATKEQELEQGKQGLEEAKIQANEAISTIDTSITTAQTNLSYMQEQKEQMEQAGLDTTEIDATISEIQSTIDMLNAQKIEIENQIKSTEEQISSAEAEIESAKQEINTQKATLEEEKNNAYKELNTAKKEIQTSKAEIEEAKSTLAQEESEFEQKKLEANTKLEEARQELNEARDEINQIEKAKWYIQDRLDNTGYTNIFDAIKTMSNISQIFPIVFYLVALLISLTSMTRMIEEERIEIGTLKSLGYTNTQIIFKYILYASLACIIGGVIGMSIGFYLLPSLVWSLYSTIYTIPEFYMSYRLDIGIKGILFAFLCIGGATIFVAYKELKNMPAVLMRPKSPKNGKKIFLERIRFIWKRLNFSKKVTARNIFRYKKRALMTIVGIAGCTGLMLTGFGIKDSIIDIPTLQYGGIFKYEISVTLSDTSNLVQLEEYMETNENIENYSEVYALTGTLEDDEQSFSVNIFVPEDEETFKQVCELKDSVTGEQLNLTDDGIIITDKVAESLNINVGDTITLMSSDDIEYELKVSAISENYVSHYIYMSKDFYETNIKSYKTNMILVNTEEEISEEERNIMSQEILNIEGVSSVTVISSILKSINDMLSVINYVVVILIISSALLAFVVLYNLANINIGERQREIATLKVLGFYDKEVDRYINKENMIFTIIGVIIGLIFGTVLTSYVVVSVEIDSLRFVRNIEPMSYLYATVITISFSIIVNWIIHFVLKKIDMIESLKSVE